jgi:hypothetical protein
MPIKAPTAAPQLSIVDQLKAKLNELKDRIFTNEDSFEKYIIDIPKPD